MLYSNPWVNYLKSWANNKAKICIYNRLGSTVKI